MKKYKYRIYYTTKGKPFTMDVTVFKDDLKSALNRFYKNTFNFDEVTYAEKIEENNMNITKKIDMFLLDESNYKIYGKEKSKIWLNLRDKILNSKSKDDLKKYINVVTVYYKSKKISLAEFTDLIDKIDQKLIKLG